MIEYFLFLFALALAGLAGYLIGRQQGRREHSLPVGWSRERAAVRPVPGPPADSQNS